MKKYISYILVVALIFAATFTSCKKDTDGDKIKLLETITSSDNKWSYKFEYDEQNRISKIIRYSEGSLHNTIPITYSENDLVEMGFVVEGNGSWGYWTFNYAISGNTINFTRTNWNHYSGVSSIIGAFTGVLTLNGDGLPVKKEEDYGGGFEYTYQYDGNGNMVKAFFPDDYTEEYKYDNNKSPFLNCKSPKWWLQDFVFWGFGFGIPNNTIVRAWDEGKTTYAYVYDSDGYLTKRTSKTEYDYDDEVIEQEITYTYIEK